MDLSARLAPHEPAGAAARIGLLAIDGEMGTPICMPLSSAGYTAVCTSDRNRFAAWAEAREIDAAIVTWPSSSFSALQSCEDIRRRTCCADLPIVLVSERADPTSRICGLEAGADLFLAYPGEQADLLPRLSELLSLARERKGWLERGDVAINHDQRKIVRHGQPVHLTFADFELLHVLISHPGEVFSHQQLANALKQLGLVGSAGTIPGHIAAIRRGLLKTGGADVLATVPGQGYAYKRELPRASAGAPRSRRRGQTCCFV